MRSYDEAWDPDGGARPHYAEALEALAATGPEAAAREAARRARELGLAVGARPLAVDPVPRVIDAVEWRHVAAGLAQRAVALERLVAAAYEPGSPGPVPPRSPYFEPDLVGTAPGEPWLGIVGFDLVRAPDGRLHVLEDNVLTPGHAAVAAARELSPIAGLVATPPVGIAAPAREALLAMLGGADGAAILGDDPPSWELRRLGRDLGVPVVTTAGLTGDARGVRARAGGRPVRVLWQRTAEDRLRDDAGAPTHLGALLLAPLRAEAVRVVNRIGCGVVHDKRALPLVEAAMDGPALLPAVPTLDLGDPAHRAAVRAAPAAHVIKPARGAGGRGIRFGADVGRDELDALLDGAADARVAQPVVALSVHPTVDGRALVPRPVDLRLFAVRAGDAWTVLPGGVSRYPTTPCARIVNTSAGGGIKDVWVLPALP